MFKITAKRGFHITFKNDVTVSVQFGWGNYCQNYNNKEANTYRIGTETKDVFCEDAEIAIFRKNGEWLTEKYLREQGKEEDMVIGYLSANEVLDILIWASKRRKKEK